PSLSRRHYGSHSHRAAVNQSGHAALDGAFDERLQRARRNERAVERRRDGFPNRGARTEANLLDAEILPHERDFLLKGDLIASAKSHAVAEEIRKQDAHSPRAGVIAADQRRDRVKTVEEAVRIDLRTERGELRVTSEHVELEAPPFDSP